MLTLTDEEIALLKQQYGQDDEKIIKIIHMNTLSKAIERIIKDNNNYINASFGVDENKLYIDGTTEYVDKNERININNLVDKIIKDEL